MRLLYDEGIPSISNWTFIARGSGRAVTGPRPNENGEPSEECKYSTSEGLASLALVAHKAGKKSFCLLATPDFKKVCAVCANLINSVAEMKLIEVCACCDALDPVLEEQKRSAAERVSRDTRLIARQGWLSLQCVLGAEKARTRLVVYGRRYFVIKNETPFKERFCSLDVYDWVRAISIVMPQFFS